MPQRQTAEMKAEESALRPHLHRHAAVRLAGHSSTKSEIEKNLPQWTQTVLASNRMKAAAEKITFADGAHDRIKHVIYIIKENRTYDQIFGDLKQDGKPVGNGDPSLTMFGEDITPNLHKLALQFGVLDNFLRLGRGLRRRPRLVQCRHRHGLSGEEPGSRPIAAASALYDFEGVGRRRLSAAAEDSRRERAGQRLSVGQSRRAWQDLLPLRRIHLDHLLHRRSVATCRQSAGRARCCRARPARARRSRPAKPIPDEWGGGVNKWPWAIPLIAANIATKPELVGHFATEAPDFELSGSRPDSSGDFPAPSEAVGRRQASRAKTPCPTSSCCACPTTTPRARGPAARRPNPRSPTTTSPWAAPSMPFPTRPSGTTPRSSSSKTTPRPAPITWTRIAASRSSSANIRRTRNGRRLPLSTAASTRRSA